jgi:heme A synthase
MLLLVLLTLQIKLGALTVLSQKHYIINSLHVVTGASVLATSLVLTLRSHRARIGQDAGSTQQDPAYGTYGTSHRPGPLGRASSVGGRA